MINQSTLHKSIYFIAKDLKHNLQALLKIQYFWHSFKKKERIINIILKLAFTG